MKFISTKSFMERMKEEHIYKNSEFMDKVILLSQSVYKYYKKYYNKNIYFHPIKLIKYLKLKKIIKSIQCQEYINVYLFDNQGWINCKYIPKERNNRLLEIVNCLGKQFRAKLLGYGFENLDVKGGDGCVFGWTCWVDHWRFIDDKSKELELVKYPTKGKNK